MGLDHAVHDRVDSFSCANKSRQTRWAHVDQPLRRRQQHQEVVEAHNAVDGVGEFVDFLAKIGGEQRARDDIQRKMHHVDGNVARLAITPSVTDAHRFADDHARVFRNALAVKGRLRDLPLRAMLCALRRDHAFAKKHLGALHRALLDEVVVLHDENFADVVRMVEEHDMVPADLVVGDVAVVVDEVLEEQNRIRGTEAAQREPQQVALKAGRKAVFGWAAELRCGWRWPFIQCNAHRFGRMTQESRPPG